MKQRKMLVSNSSSSSFILVLDKGETSPRFKEDSLGTKIVTYQDLRAYFRDIYNTSGIDDFNELEGDNLLAVLDFEDYEIEKYSEITKALDEGKISYISCVDDCTSLFLDGSFENASMPWCED